VVVALIVAGYFYSHRGDDDTSGRGAGVTVSRTTSV
jgi:hypothetical protein